MDINVKNKEANQSALIALKQASIIKTLALASVAFKNGTVKVIQPQHCALKISS